MTVTLHVFATLRERLGRSTWEEDVDEGQTTSDLVRKLADRSAVIADLAPVLRVAVNDEWTTNDVVLCDGDDVALLTPVSGG